MFDAEAVNAIANLGREAEKIERFKIPQGEAVFWFDRKSGGINRRPPDDPALAITADTVDSFCAITKALPDDLANPPPWLITISPGLVRLTFRSRDTLIPRSCRLDMPLKFSEEFNQLQELSGSMQFMDQADFVRMLRTRLYECGVAELLQTVRAIKVSSAENGESVVSVGNQSIVRDVKRAALAGGHELPDSIILTAPVYIDDDFPDPKQISCAIDFDFDGPEFALMPLAGQCAQAVREVNEAIRQRIEHAVGPRFLVVHGQQQ